MSQINLKPKIASIKQQEYIEQLCIDIGFSDRKRRFALLTDILGRKVNYLDEIYANEIDTIISKLKEYKYIK